MHPTERPTKRVCYVKIPSAAKTQHSQINKQTCYEKSKKALEKYMFGKQMFAGPSRDNGAERGL